MCRRTRAIQAPILVYTRKFLNVDKAFASCGRARGVHGTQDDGAKTIWAGHYLKTTTNIDLFGACQNEGVASDRRHVVRRHEDGADWLDLVARSVRAFNRLVCATFFAVALCMSATFALPGELDTSFGSGGTTTIDPATGKLTAGNSIVVAGSKVIVGGRVGAAGSVSFAYTEYNLSGVAVSTARIHTKTFSDILANPGSNVIASTTTPVPWTLTQEEVMPRFALDPVSGKLVAAGTCAFSSGNRRPCAVRFNADGTSDNTFNGTGFWQSTASTAGDITLSAIAFQSDGKLVIAATCAVQEAVLARRMCIYRLNTNGTEDTTEFAGVQPAITSGTGVRDVYDIAVSLVIRSDGFIGLFGRCLRTAPMGSQKRWGACVNVIDPTQSAGVFEVYKNDFLAAAPDGYNYPRAFTALSNTSVLMAGGCTTGEPATATPNSSILRGCISRIGWTGGAPFFTIDIDFAYSAGDADGFNGVALTAANEPRSYRSIFAQANGKVIAVRARPSAASVCCTYEIVRLTSNGVDEANPNWVKTQIAAISAASEMGVPGLAVDTSGRSYSGTHVTSGGNQTIKLSRFQGDPLSCNFDLDGNGGAPNAETDGVLALRYLAGYRDPNFTTGALGAGASRTDYAAINSFIVGNCSGTLATSCTLDIDGDNRKLPSTDGVLLVRAMLGVANVAGAIGTGASRNTWSLVRMHLQNNCGMIGLPP
jgi:hypothetical protein